MLRIQLVLFTLIAFAAMVAAQPTPERKPSPLDPTVWGVVYDTPATTRVTVRKDVTYLVTAAGELTIDIYTPPATAADAKLPAVIFLNGIGDRPADKVKNWEIYRSWPRLVAAHGMIGISMDADGTRIQDCLRGLFEYLGREGAKHRVDADRLGVYAASANVTQSMIYLQSTNAFKGIRAAAMFYGGAPDGALRTDLPVLFIVAEGDMAGLGRQSLPLWQKVAESRAPWTLVFASRMPHAFDAFEDNDESRRHVMQALSFWKTNLEPVREPGWKPSSARAIVSATYGTDYQRTADLLAAYTAENPTDPQGFVLLGRTLQQLRRTDEAAAAFERALALQPDDMRAHGGLGGIRVGQRRYADAIPHLERAVAGGMRNSMIYGQLAFAQLGANQNEAAIKNYENAFAAGIPPGANTRGLAYYNMASGYVRLGQKDKAFEMLSQAIAEGFNNRATFEADQDLAPLRTDPRFQALLPKLTN